MLTVKVLPMSISPTVMVSPAGIVGVCPLVNFPAEINWATSPGNCG